MMTKSVRRAMREGLAMLRAIAQFDEWRHKFETENARLRAQLERASRATNVLRELVRTHSLLPTPENDKTTAAAWVAARMLLAEEVLGTEAER